MHLAETRELIDTKLRSDWIPEQVSGWLNCQHAIQVDHEWIYLDILADKQVGGDLYRHLRGQKKRRKRYGNYDRRGIVPNRVSNEEPPAIVEEGTRLGDWEGGTIIGKRQRHAIVALTDRRSGFSLLAKVD